MKKSSLPDIYTANRKTDLSGKLWVVPMHFPGTILLAASFRGHGYDADYLDFEDQETVQIGKRVTRGSECLPMILSIGAMIKKCAGDKTRRHILFMPTAEGPCRFGQYNLLERIIFHREGLDNFDVFGPSSINSYQGLDETLRRYLMHTMMVSDIFLKLLCKVRPYEKTKGDTDSLLEKCIAEMVSVMEKKENPRPHLKKMVDRFAAIPRLKERRPLVGIVGEIYVRCDPYANADLVRVIEENGGEAWVSPMHEWGLYTAYMQSYLARNFKFSLVEMGESLIKNMYMFQTEKSYYRAVSKLLADRHEPDVKDVVAEGIKYLPIEFVGEAVLTIGRAVLFAKQGADMVVNVAPFGCMPGTITSSIFLELKDHLNIPVISQFYDGTLGMNDKVAAMLKTIS